MFQTRPTPFASSFHTPSPHSPSQSYPASPSSSPAPSYPHSYAHSHSPFHTHLSRHQHHASHNVGGYDMGVEGEGGVMGATTMGGMGGTGMELGMGMEMEMEMTEMNDYCFPANATTMGLQVGSSSGANCMDMDLAASAPAPTGHHGHHGHGHSMASPLSHSGHALSNGPRLGACQHHNMAVGGMSMDNFDMEMAEMEMSMHLSPPSQSASQSPSQSLPGLGLSLGGVGEAASAGAGSVSAARAAHSASLGASLSGPFTRNPAVQGPQPLSAPVPRTTALALALAPSPSPTPPTPPSPPAVGPIPAGAAITRPQVPLHSSPSTSQMDLFGLSSTVGPVPGLEPRPRPGPGRLPFHHRHHHHHHHNSSPEAYSSQSRHVGASSSSSITSSSTFCHCSTSSPSTAPVSNIDSANSRPSTMDPGDPSDLAAQEAAARDYHPQLEGPLVGDKITSDAITDEYAKADDVFVAKTIALPQTFSHYRPIQGDGNCGWRAIGFSYFEHLANNGDHEQMLGEIARITSLNQYLLDVGGYDRLLFEDMVEETINLLRDVANNISNTQLAHQLVLQRFNDGDASNAIIYHLRLLASSWLKGNPNDYAPFIPGEAGIAGYCDELQLPNREIDHLGLQLLVQVLLKPANMVLEIAYLDRSAGSQVNSYRMPDEAVGQDPANLGPIIYLLYRPDHYDILYKPLPNPTPHGLNLQVNRATSFSHRHEIMSVTPSLQTFANIDYSPLAMLPGFGGPPSGLSSGLSSLGSPTSTSPIPDAYDGLPQSPWLATSYPDHVQQQQPQQQSVPTPRPQPEATPQPPPQQSTPPSGKPSQPVDYQLRFSPQCWHLSNSAMSQPSILSSQASFPEPSFTTAMFKNSHFNKAHYQNPHFHPEEWTPDDDTHERVNGGKKKGKIKLEH